jgi:hypothetical protein
MADNDIQTSVFRRRRPRSRTVAGRRAGLARIVALILAPLCALAISVPAVAGQRAPAGPARPSALAGYTYWNGSGQSTTYNESGQAISTDNFATGAYVVTFDGLGAITGGNVQATAGAGFTTCSVLWGPSGTNLQVNVWCFSLGTGIAENSPFSLTVTQPRSAPGGPYDYAFVYKDATSGTLTGAYQYSSARKKDRVAHLGTGRYQVTLGGRRSAGTAGTVKVTPWGNEPGGCNVTGWHGSSTGEIVTVDCSTAAFAPQNRPFVLVYAKRTNLMGLAGKTTASAYASRRAAAVYQPKVQYDSHRGARVTVLNSGPGRYQILFAGSGSGQPGANPGDIQVSAVGPSRQCFIDTWVQAVTPNAYVDCDNKTGHLANAAFTIAWVVA